MDHIDAVCPVDGHAAPSCDIAADLVARYRAAAFGKVGRNIAQSFDDNPASGICLQVFGAVFVVFRQNLRVCYLNRMVLAVFVEHFIDDAGFFDAPVPDGGQTGIPVMETVFAHDL